MIGDAIDLEALEEGFQGTAVTIDGVTFSRGRDGFPPPENAMFAIDDGTGVWDDNPAMLAFVHGKLLQLNAFSPGSDGYTFSVLKSLELASREVRTGVRLNVAYVARIIGEIDFSPSEITLLALNDEARRRLDDRALNAAAAHRSGDVPSGIHQHGRQNGAVFR